MANLTLAGDEENWSLLQRSSKRDWSLVVRTRAENAELRAFAERNSVFAVQGWLRPGDLMEGGIPVPELADGLYAWEDEIVAHFDGAASKVFLIAVVSGEGRKDLYFAAEAPANFSRSIATIASPHVAETRIEPIHDLPALWSLLVPTDLEKHMGGDRSVITSLEDHGDDGSRPRSIDFWFYGARADLQELLLVLQPEGFRVAQWVEEPSGLIVSLQAPATVETFEGLTPRLLEYAAAHDVEYDGWESEVVAPKPEAGDKGSFFGRLFGPKP